MTDAIIFIDALSPSEAEGVLDEWKQGELDAGTPRVTPQVMGSIYTGQPAEETAMMASSRWGEPHVGRPQKSTFIDQIVREGVPTLSMDMPYCAPFGDYNQDSWLHGEGVPGETTTEPEEASDFLDNRPPEADMVYDRPDRVYASFRDNIHLKFHQFKEALRALEPAVAFLGIRLIDSYCHFQYGESRGGKTYREHLVSEIAEMCENVHHQIDGDVMFFSDHGQTEMTDVFRINRWLSQKGYLEYDIDKDYIDKQAYWEEGEKHPVETRVGNMVVPKSDGVEVDEEASDVICGDPYDSSLTLLSDRSEFDVESLREDLMGTGLVRDVEFKWEKYDEDGTHYDEMPDVIVDRGEGVYVTQNIHEKPIGMGYHRTGVHHFKGCYGASCDLNIPEGNGRGGRVLPEQMHDIITDFIGLELHTPPISEDRLATYTEEEVEILTEQLEDLQ